MSRAESRVVDRAETLVLIDLEVDVAADNCCAQYALTITPLSSPSIAGKRSMTCKVDRLALANGYK